MPPPAALRYLPRGPGVRMGSPSTKYGKQRGAQRRREGTKSRQNRHSHTRCSANGKSHKSHPSLLRPMIAEAGFLPQHRHRPENNRTVLSGRSELEHTQTTPPTHRRTLPHCRSQPPASRRTPTVEDPNDFCLLPREKLGSPAPERQTRYRRPRRTTRRRRTGEGRASSATRWAGGRCEARTSFARLFWDGRIEAPQGGEKG